MTLVHFLSRRCRTLDFNKACKAVVLSSGWVDLGGPAVLQGLGEAYLGRHQLVKASGGPSHWVLPVPHGERGPDDPAWRSSANLHQLVSGPTVIPARSLQGRTGGQHVDVDVFGARLSFSCARSVEIQKTHSSSYFRITNGQLRCALQRAHHPSPGVPGQAPEV